MGLIPNRQAEHLTATHSSLRSIASGLYISTHLFTDFKPMSEYCDEDMEEFYAQRAKAL